ncbi:hypothetical protein RM553_00220 [Zunongwangia sp. F363]|uniref:Helix-turn-helix domain-containing protein n=1 Tax=Autumnicola tepida TaxID=3075595 RepID=A0ABU3C4J9_9FLAO|nr:hypothetical protein [Zunongwangia sp. F363]MDT0641241.1 hypothetical protein [Zunongwangia sp. F363]
MNSYEFSRLWFDYSFLHPGQVKPVHSAIYFFAIERCNRLGWKAEFGFPTDLAMEALGIKNYRTYIRALQDLVDWGFIRWIQKSSNQYTANVIALVKNTEAPAKALDNALSLHSTKQVQSIASINKQLNHKPINHKTFFNKPLLKIDKSEIPENELGYYEWAVKFQELFLKNLKNKGAPLKRTEMLSFEDGVKPIRLMMEKDGVSENQLQLAYDFLDGNDEFWKGIILDTKKLRQKIGQLIAQGKKPVKTENMDLRLRQKIKSYD